MKTLNFLMACIVYCNFAFAQSDQQQLSANVDELLSAHFKSNEPGAAALIAKKGNVVYQKAFGMSDIELDTPMNTGNVFRIASITKQFTAVAILQLMEQGKLSLEDNILKYVPDFPSHDRKITIEHLLTHTSGIANHTDMPEHMGRIDITAEDMIGHFKNLPLKFLPGAQYSYSNNGYFLLGHIIEKVSGKTYAEYLDDHFFKPLEMTSSGYGSDSKIVKDRASGYIMRENGFENAQPLSMSHPHSAGAIQSTVMDLYKWHQALVGHKLISKQNLAKAISTYKLTDGKESPYGYGLRIGQVYESASIWHGGLIQGFMTMAIYLPKEDIFVALFSNCESYPIDKIAPQIAALAAGKSFKHDEVAIEREMLPQYVGVYENNKGQLRIITESGGRLFSQINRGSKFNARPYAKDSFFFNENPLLTLEFSRNKKGIIDKLISMNINGNETWNKTGKPIPSEDGIRVDAKIIESYLGEYEMTPEFKFTVTAEDGNLYIRATGQEKLQMFAETTSKFFLKVNDAQIEFINESGKVSKIVMSQGGRQAMASKIR